MAETTIEYNGENIASLSEGQTAVVDTEGHTMEGNIVVKAGSGSSGGGSSEALSVRTINGTKLKFFVGTQAEYDSLADDQKQGLFAIISDDATKEAIMEALAENTIAIDENKTIIDEQAATIEEQASAIERHTTAIDGLAATLVGHTTDIAGHTETLTAHTETLTAHGNSLTALSEHATTLSEHTRKLASIESKLASIESKLNALEMQMWSFHGGGNS